MSVLPAVALASFAFFGVVSVGLSLWTVTLNMRTAKINAEIVRLLQEHSA